MKIVILKKDEMVIKKKEYIDMLIKMAKLEERANMFNYFSINDIRKLLELSKFNESEVEEYNSFSIERIM